MGCYFYRGTATFGVQLEDNKINVTFGGGGGVNVRVGWALLLEFCSKINGLGSLHNVFTVMSHSAHFDKLLE